MHFVIASHCTRATIFSKIYLREEFALDIAMLKIAKTVYSFHDFDKDNIMPASYIVCGPARKIQGALCIHTGRIYMKPSLMRMSSSTMRYPYVFCNQHMHPVIGI